MQLNFRVFQLDLIVQNGGLGRVAIGFRGVQGAASIGIIQSGQELPFGHAGTFVKEDTGDPTGNLGGDGGATARGDVATGIEYAGRAGGRLGGGGNFDLCFAVAIGKCGATHKARDNDSQSNPNPAPTAARVGALGVGNAQRRQIGL